MMTIPYILVVDDDPALLQALPQALSLRISGIRVDTSDSAQEALRYVRDNDYDAIVSDIKMPGMDGLVLMSKIQEMRPETPTLLITGHGEHNLAVHALRGGAYDLIQKPIDRDYFIAALSRAIQTHQLRRQVWEQQRKLEEHARSLEDLVQQRTRELVKASAAKDEFLSIASHELKTPLASLKAMTQLLRRQHEQTDPAETAKLLNMERSIRRMEVLVNDLLNTSLIETGMFALHCLPCDLAALCLHIRDEYVMGTDISLNLEIPDAPVMVLVDFNRISQVIINLLSNASKYAPKDTPVTLRITSDADSGIISVSDAGVGIPQEMLPYLFQRFFRVPGVEVQTGSSIGLGLGLYIASKIVERHGGRIDVQSHPGEGSTFSVILPLITEIMNTVDTLEDQSV